MGQTRLVAEGHARQTRLVGGGHARQTLLVAGGRVRHTRLVDGILMTKTARDRNYMSLCRGNGCNLKSQICHYRHKNDIFRYCYNGCNS